jgi:branched-chain amino acid transport system substrate-binding protein
LWHRRWSLIVAPILSEEDAVTADAPSPRRAGAPHNASADNGYACCALVSSAGTIEEVSGPEGAHLLRGAPALVEYARVLLATGKPAVRFWWRSPQAEWLNVTIAAVQRDPDQAEVTLDWSAPPYDLTSRELDVLTLIAGGLSNQEIASRLFTSPKTVSTHVEHLLHKLSTPTRAGAAAIAAEQGVVRLPVPGGGHRLESLAIGLLDQAPPATPAAGPLPQPGTRLARQKRPFLLGSAFPLHGPAQSDGLEMRSGAELAIAEINAQGGIAGRPVRQIVVDTDIFTAHGVEAAFQQLTAADVDAITGGYVFAEEAARDVASAYGAPYLHATTSERQVELIRDDPGRYGRIFHVCPSEVHYGSGFVRFLDQLTELGRWRPASRRLLFIECAVPSGQMANDATIIMAEQSGWLIDHVEVVPAVGADWHEVMQVIHRRDPAAIMITQFLPSELADFQRTFVADPTDSLIYAVYSPSIPQFLDSAGPTAEGLIWSTVSGTYGDHIGTRFAQRYEAAYGRPPGRSHAGIAYDEVHLLAQAWATVGNPRNFAAVAAQLRRAAHRGVNGTYVFDHAGQCGLAYPDVTPDPSIGQAHLVLQIQHGRHRTLAPAPYAVSQFVRPPWMSRAA